MFYKLLFFLFSWIAWKRKQNMFLRMFNVRILVGNLSQVTTCNYRSMYAILLQVTEISHFKEFGFALCHLFFVVKTCRKRSGIVTKYFNYSTFHIIYIYCFVLLRIFTSNSANS